jgi:UDP-N-acetylglucosamine 2-epimerase (non-hydrolysing)
MIDVVCGARPNFMKVDPILRKLDPSIPARLVHTGQHYDRSMSDSFFEELGLPVPDVNLEVGSASITKQTALVMERYEESLPDPLPEAVIVVGDVNSTLACALTAVRYGIPVVHVEAGLRSGDRTMPEEINRLLTDQISDLLLITSYEARSNLRAEGRPESAVVMVGNPMIDTLLRLLPAARRSKLDPPAEGAGLVTLHRPSNVDSADRLEAIFRALGKIGELEFVFPVHPRTLRSISSWGLEGKVPANVRLTQPMGYLEFTAREEKAAVVITDSGGVQEETTVLGVPCVTVRPNTERPITIEMGTNALCPEPDDLPGAVRARMAARPPAAPSIPFWDGEAGGRIASAIGGFLRCR